MPNAWVYIRLDYFCVVTYQKKVVTQLLAKRESFKKRERSNVIPNTTLFDQMLKFGWPQLDFLISFSLAGRSKHTWKEDCICLMGLFFFCARPCVLKELARDWSRVCFWNHSMRAWVLNPLFRSVRLTKKVFRTSYVQNARCLPFSNSN